MGDNRNTPGKNISFGGFSFKKAVGNNSGGTEKPNNYSMNAVSSLLIFFSSFFKCLLLDPEILLYDF